MNKKGFTLVELLGVIVILSIIMLIAIPNIASMVERSKRDTYIADAKKMVSLVQYAIRKGEVNKPLTGNLEKVTLNTLSTSDVEKDADGNTYDLDKSYVVLTRKDGFIEYYVQLVAMNSNNNYTGISLVNSDNLDTDKRYDTYNNNLAPVSIDDNNNINQIINGN